MSASRKLAINTSASRLFVHLRIKLLEREITTLARSKYTETTWLEQIPGVGPITALYFVLKIQDPARFERVRDVGALIGLRPRRDQS
jgi:transposase